MQAEFLVVFVLDLLVAAVVYALSVALAFWQIPRRRHVLPGILIAFAGAMGGGGAFARFEGGLPFELTGAALGSLVLVFAAVKVGTPASAVLTVDTEGVSGHAGELAREGFEVPFVWPYHLSIEKYGSVVFDLVGKPGVEVTIEFPAANTPFGNDREGKPRTTFRGVVPERIHAAPVIVPSRGKYVIRQRDPETGETRVHDPTWNTPRRDD